MSLLGFSAIRPRLAAFVAVASCLVSSANAGSVQVKVTIKNLAPEGGSHLTPLWVGFHDGTFKTFAVGMPASSFLGSSAIERLAEDGDTGGLSTEFIASNKGTIEGTILGKGAGPGFPGAPVIAPGGKTSMIFTIDAMDPKSRYFSYASMIIPSNDAFIGNADPMAFEVFDKNGHSRGVDFVVAGSRVLDGGVEVNDEVPGNTAFLAQPGPNVGVDEGGVVHPHVGFIPGGTILSDPRFANADFPAAGYNVARITVQTVPEPATFVSAALGVGFLAVSARRFRRR